MNTKNKEKEGLFRSIFTAYFILLLHVFLLAGTGVTIVLFKGVYHYLPWVMGSIGVLVLLIAWIFYQRMRKSSSDIKQILSMPEFRERAVEVTFLGGLASFKVKAPVNQQARIDHQPSSHSSTLLIEDDINKTEQKITRLSALYEKDIISKKEFEKAKQKIIQG